MGWGEILLLEAVREAVWRSDSILVFQRVGAISIEIMMTMRMGDMTAIIDSV